MMTSELIGVLLAALLGLWVFADARRRHVPRPVLWGMATFLLAIVAVPAYLWTVRRTMPPPRRGPRRCPHCGDPIQPTATVCMHCGQDVGEA